MKVRGRRNPVPSKPDPLKQMFPTHRHQPSQHAGILSYAKGAGEAPKASKDNSSRRHQKHYGKQKA